VSRSLSPRVAGLLALAGIAVVGGMAAGRAELVVLAAPFIIFVAVALAMAREPQLRAGLVLERTRVIEGEQVEATVTLRNEGGAIEVELELLTSGELALEPGGRLLVRLAPGARTSVQFLTRPRRWGAHQVGPLVVRVRDPLGIATWDRVLNRRVALRAFPGEQRLREVVAPLHTQPFLGTHVARMRAEGIEFADIRPFAGGDRARQVNWRATARRGALHVTERHPEHASEVVLLLDTFAEAREGASGTLDAAVRATASLARAHLARRDRVALVDFGGTLHWLEPAFGTIQLYRIVDALIASEIAFSYAWRAVESIPRRVLPPSGLVLAVSPLLDERSLRLITDLRTRGVDLVVVEISPLPHAAPGSFRSDELAHRLWRLQREALRTRLRGLGIGVALWDDAGALGPSLEEVNGFRRSVRHGVRV
jgi:uncharacterized protein (DUF58 family)